MCELTHLVQRREKLQICNNSCRNKLHKAMAELPRRQSDIHLLLLLWPCLHFYKVSKNIWCLSKVGCRHITCPYPVLVSLPHSRKSSHGRRYIRHDTTKRLFLAHCNWCVQTCTWMSLLGSKEMSGDEPADASAVSIRRTFELRTTDISGSQLRTTNENWDVDITADLLPKTAGARATPKINSTEIPRIILNSWFMPNQSPSKVLTGNSPPFLSKF